MMTSCLLIVMWQVKKEKENFNLNIQTQKNRRKKISKKNLSATFQFFSKHSVQRGWYPPLFKTTPPILVTPPFLNVVLPPLFRELFTPGRHFVILSCNSYILCFSHKFYDYLVMKVIVYQILFTNDRKLYENTKKNVRRRRNFLKNEEYKYRKRRKSQSPG